MSVLFDSYEIELQTSLKRAKMLMNNLPFITEEEKVNSIKEIRKKIREAEINKNKMECEYSVASSHLKGHLKKKVTDSFKALAEVSKKFNQLESQYLENLQYENLRGNTNRCTNRNNELTLQNTKLQNLYRLAHETQEIVNHSNIELFRQRGIILKLGEDNQEIDQGLERVNHLARSIRNKDLINKGLLWITIFLLGFLNILVFFAKIRRLSL